MKISGNTLSFHQFYSHFEETKKVTEVIQNASKNDHKKGVKVTLSQQTRKAFGQSFGHFAGTVNGQRIDTFEKSTRFQLEKSVKAKMEMQKDINPAAIKAQKAKEATLDQEDAELLMLIKLIRQILKRAFDKDIEELESIRVLEQDFIGGMGLGKNELDGTQTRFVQPSDGASDDLSQIESAEVESPEIRMVSKKEETESLQFQAKGQLQTSDGGVINLDLSFAMSFHESHYEEKTKTINALSAPLVINLEGQFANLTEARFRFDMDGDGVKEELPGLGGGSHFLAIDNNNNQKVDGPDELLGANTGSGFSDLAQYDDDGNGFIDEGDDIYAKLMVWKPGGQLLSLAEVGVGAIHLRSIQTPFQNLASGSDGESLGSLRSTSIFVKENGGVGTVQQLDMHV